MSPAIILLYSLPFQVIFCRKKSLNFYAAAVANISHSFLRRFFSLLSLILILGNSSCTTEIWNNWAERARNEYINFKSEWIFLINFHFHRVLCQLGVFQLNFPMLKNFQHLIFNQILSIIFFHFINLIYSHPGSYYTLYCGYRETTTHKIILNNLCWFFINYWKS